MVFDPAGKPLAGAHVRLDSASGAHLTVTTTADGSFTVALPAWGVYNVGVEASDFAPLARTINLYAENSNILLHLERVTTASEEMIVTANISEVTMTSPDPSQKVLVREELLDANPGRPGAPVSIPGLPIETAAGGIKAPQYFVPGVAGDHGEPIAQYIAVGSYLVTNNLSANAHGNGYADPNIYISSALSSVATDGGAFNVLEGNHALNLAATYNLRPQLQRFLTLTGDYRDIDLTAGFAPSNSANRQWLAIEANYGNGLLKDMEHRQQYKWNAQRVIDLDNHEITLFSIGYWGKSHEGNVVPLGLGKQLNDTVDARQQDQTHTAILAADDRWKFNPSDEIALSLFIRTYNLALFSNFGEGLIRQSEFRTVEGAEARVTHTFSPKLEAMAGFDYHEDDIHRDNLDHYRSDNAHIFGPFLKVLSNNITIRELAPYLALHDDLGKHLRIYVGLRPEVIEINNMDKLKPADSFDMWTGFVSPKATLAWTPNNRFSHILPSASFSIGQAYFSEDPRAAVANSTTPQIIEHSHSEQLVLEKEFSATDLRITLGRTTTTANSGKIDPDKGTAEDLGPGSLNFLTVGLRHQFSIGTLQAVLSKADARLANTATKPALITPEAPRTIFDTLATLDRIPLGLHARGEYEYVGHKLLDLGNPQHPSIYEAIPVGETRLAVVRPFMNGRLELARIIHEDHRHERPNLLQTC